MPAEVIINVQKFLRSYLVQPWEVASTYPGWNTTRQEIVNLNETFYAIGGMYQLEDNVIRMGVNEIWKSSDGLSWNLEVSNAPFPIRFEHVAILFKGKVLVIGGVKWEGQNSDTIYGTPRLLKDVWQSTNGRDYTLLTDNAGCGFRQGHASIVYNEKVWVFGGFNSTNYSNDIWYSEDGVAWIRATSSAPWGIRMRHTAFELDGKMWIYGGHNQTTYLNDSWYSTDGVQWTQGPAVFDSGRAGISSISFLGRVFIVGGFDFTGGLKEVVTSEDGLTWNSFVSLNYKSTYPVVYTKGNTLFTVGTDSSETYEGYTLESISLEDITLGEEEVLSVCRDPRNLDIRKFQTEAGLSTFDGVNWEFSMDYVGVNVIRVSVLGDLFLGYSTGVGVFKVTSAGSFSFLSGKTVQDITLSDSEAYIATNLGLFVMPLNATSETQVEQIL
jgi:hypothetical protein